MNCSCCYVKNALLTVVKKISKNSWKEDKCFEKLLSQNLQLYLKKSTLRLNQKQPFRGVPKKSCSENTQQIYGRTPTPKCDFNKVAKQLYWIHTLAWVFSCKFAAYFQNTFPRNISGGLLLAGKQLLVERLILCTAWTEESVNKSIQVNKCI